MLFTSNWHDWEKKMSGEDNSDNNNEQVPNENDERLFSEMLVSQPILDIDKQYLSELGVDSEMFRCISQLQDEFNLSDKRNKEIFNTPELLEITNAQREVNEMGSIKFSDSFLLPIGEDIDHVELRNYREQSLALLTEIRNNTANLTDLINLISDNSEKQDTIIQVLSEILGIATAKSKEELDQKLAQTIEKIKNTIEAGELISKLIFYSITVFSTVSKNF